MMRLFTRVGMLMAFWIGGLNLFSNPSSGYEPEQVLQALRQYDEAAWRQYSLTVAVEDPPLWGEAYSYRLRATSHRSTTVVVSDQTQYRGQLTYSYLSGGPWRGQPSLGRGLCYGRDYEVWSLLEKGRGYYVEASAIETVEVSPENQQIASYRGGFLIEISRSPKDTKGYSLLTRAQEGVGRGFSRNLGRALSVKELPDGRLELWATTKESSEWRWRLVVDPSQQFLVVRAEVIAPDGTVDKWWEFEGIVEAPIPLARRGTHYNEALRDISDSPVWRFECLSYEPCFRQDWYDEVRQKIRRPPSGAQVWDMRVEPFTEFIIK